MEVFHGSEPTGFPSHRIASLALVTGVLLIAGCSRHKPAAAADNPVPATVATTPDNGAANPAAAVQPQVAPVAIAPAGPDPAPMLAQLTHVLRRYSVEHRRVPQALNELVAAGYLAALPAAPAGKQFAIDPKHLEVILK
jgi:hypothetical protein